MDQDFAKLVTAEAVKQAKNSNERLGFAVRPGVTFKGIEVFWGNRVAQIDPNRVKYNAENGTLDNFAGHVVRSLRGRSMIPRPVEIYRVQDVLHEQVYGIIGLLRLAAPDTVDVVEKEMEAYIEKESGGEKLAEVVRWRLALEYLESILVRRIQSAKTNTKKKETPCRKSS